LPPTWSHVFEAHSNNIVTLLLRRYRADFPKKAKSAVGSFSAFVNGILIYAGKRRDYRMAGNRSRPPMSSLCYGILAR